MFYPTNEACFHRQLREVAYYEMCRCTEEEHVAMNLVVRDHARCFIICQTRTERLIDYVPPIGTALPFHASACGKILLSELPEPILAEILNTIKLQKMTDNTITDRDAFMDELLSVRRSGYAVDHCESDPQGSCIAVPVRFYQNQIVAALSFSGFIGKITNTEIKRYAAVLTGASHSISDKLKCLAGTNE